MGNGFAKLSAEWRGKNTLLLRSEMLRVETRLHRAQQLLKNPALSINEVALATGFRHLGLIHKTFKRRFGMTPSAWRDGKQARNFH